MPANGRWDLIRRLKVKVSNIPTIIPLLSVPPDFATCFSLYFLNYN